MKISAFAAVLCLATSSVQAQTTLEAFKLGGDRAFLPVLFTQIKNDAARASMPLPRATTIGARVGAGGTAFLDEAGVPQGVTEIAGPIGLSMSAGLRYQPSPEELAKIEKAFQRFSTLVWNETWGDMYVKEVLILKAPATGYITLDRLPQKEGGYAYFNGPFVVSTNLLNLMDPETGIRILAAGMLHEFNHSMFLLPDEYPYEGEPDLPVKMCVMDPRSRVTGLCPHCQGLILDRFKKFLFPAGIDPKDWAARNPAPATSFIR